MFRWPLEVVYFSIEFHKNLALIAKFIHFLCRLIFLFCNSFLNLMLIFNFMFPVWFQLDRAVQYCIITRYKIIYPVLNIPASLILIFIVNNFHDLVATFRVSLNTNALILCPRSHRIFIK